MILEEYKRKLDGDETSEFVYEGEAYDVMNPIKNNLIKNAVRIGLWTITGILFMLFISSPVVFHYWINH